MDTQFKASSRVRVNADPGSNNSVRSTSWVVKNAAWVPRVGDVLHEEGYYWWDVTELTFSRGLDVVNVTLVRQEWNPVLEVDEWENVLKWVGDLEQLGLSPLGPPKAGDHAKHTRVSSQTGLRDEINEPLSGTR